MNGRKAKGEKLETRGTAPGPKQTERILGVPFFNGTVDEAVTHFVATGGLLAIPAAPALIKLNYDDTYRHILSAAEMVLLDSGLLALLSKLRGGRTFHKISGISYMTCLLQEPQLRASGTVVWVVRSEIAKQKALRFLASKNIPVAPEEILVAANGENHALLLEIEARRSRHVVLALRTGAQEELGLYLREYLLHRPAIHCVGAALGFLTGDEQSIPDWAQRTNLGWLVRLVGQPRMLLPRIGIAVLLTAMVLRYGADSPRLRTRWTEV